MNERIVLCQDCGSEGRLRWPSYRRDEYGNEMEHETDCDSCEGTGGEIIETQPIDMEDLAKMLAGCTVHVIDAAIWEYDENGDKVEVGQRSYTYQNPVGAA